MNLQYAGALLVSAAISASLAWYCWSRRPAPGATGLTAYLLAFVVWSLTYAVRWTVNDAVAQFFWLRVTYFGVEAASPLFLIFVLQFTDRSHLLTRRNLALLAVEPTVTLLLLWTDHWHALFFGGAHPTGAILQGGPWFYINVVYLYLLSLLNIGMLARAFVNAPPLLRRQTGIVLCGGVWVVIGSAVSLSGLNPFTDLDVTHFFVVPAGITLAYGVFRYHLFDIVPVAHGKVIESMPDGVLVVDRQWRIVDLNRAARSITGLPEQVIGVEAAVAVAAWPDLGDLTALPGKPPREVRGLRDPESAFEVGVVPLLDARHQVTGYVVTLHDLTERKRAEKALRASERRFREMAEAFPHGVWIVDADGNAEYLNRHWVEYTGIPEAGQLGRAWMNTIHPDDREGMRAAWLNALRTTSVYNFEYRIRRADGTYRWFLARAVPIRDAVDGSVKWLGSSTEIEDQKQSQEAMRRFSVELAHRVDERTAQLRATVKNLEEFNYCVSHDLHVPLRHIDGYLRALEEACGDQLPESARRYLDRLRTGGQRMRHMIEALRRLSGLELAAVHPHPIDIGVLARAAFAELRRDEDDRPVELIVGPLPPANGDAMLVRQLLDQLLANALKFTRPVASARIEVGSERRDGEDVFYVRDNGVGFDSRYADKLFRVFHRLHGDDEFEGIGVGLSIVNRIVVGHGGRVWAESAPGQGATFYFTLARMA